MPQNIPTFAELLDGAQHSAVHLEMRDAYGVAAEAEDFRNWLENGERDMDPSSPYWQPWVSLVRRTVERGVSVRRVRIVSLPASDYIRFEHAGTSVNIKAGEQVRWLPRRRASALALPGNDFWLLDGQVVRWNHFSGNGASGGGEISEEPATAKLCADAFESAWSRAVPHAEFEIA